ncbi:MAG TPA: FHA domain-containing protein [Bacilli bacterium]|nr:FHA domain-containing protein [Bacilli bacterium]
MTDPNAKRARSFQCRDILWEALEQMAGELECSVDYLVNEALKQYVRQRGQRLPVVMRLRDEPGAPPPTPGMHGGPPPMQQPSMHHGQTATPPPVGRVGTQPPTTPIPPPLVRQPAVPPAPPTLVPPRPVQGMDGMGKPGPGMAPPYATPAPPQVRSPERLTATNLQMAGGPPPVPPGFAAPSRYQTMMGGPGGAPPPPPSVSGSPYATPLAGGLPPPPVPQLQREGPPMATPAPPRAKPSSAPPPPPGAAGAQVPTPPLYALYGGTRMQVDKDRFIIGRGKQAVDLTIKDPNISRQHAMVEYTSGQYFIVDLGSTNGIEHNGQRITRKVIAEGDLIRICDHEVRFTYR